MNVISIINSGKRHYGEEHWFWGMWLNIDDINEYDGSAPLASGFCSTKATARSAAWNALHERQQRRAYSLGWARRYLWALEEQDQRPLFSRCSLGNNRWQWVVTKSYCDDEPMASGIATSAEAALQEAQAIVGSVRQNNNGAAKYFRRKELAKKRSKHATKDRGASAVEFAYKCYRYLSDYDGKAHDVIDKHRIVKRTKKRVYVEKEEYREGAQLNGDWRDYVQPTFILDRREFEDNGKAKRSSQGWWDHKTYYVDPEIYFAERALGSRPECFEVLDVPADATADVIATAYRHLAAQTHPDVGGTAEEFKRIHSAYEQALGLVG